MTNNPLFTTQLPPVFTVAIDYTQGTQITVNSDLVFKTEYEVHSWRSCNGSLA